MPCQEHSCLHDFLPFTHCHAEWRPMLHWWMSSSTVWSQVRLGRPVWWQWHSRTTVFKCHQHQRWSRTPSIPLAKLPVWKIYLKHMALRGRPHIMWLKTVEMTWNPTTPHWPEAELIQLRTTRSGGCWQRLVLCSLVVKVNSEWWRYFINNPDTNNLIRLGVEPRLCRLLSLGTMTLPIAMSKCFDLRSPPCWCSLGHCTTYTSVCCC